MAEGPNAEELVGCPKGHQSKARARYSLAMSLDRLLHWIGVLGLLALLAFFVATMSGWITPFPSP
jgi:hypothetical protein